MKSFADTTAKIINISYLHDIAEGNKEFICEILEMFIRDLPDGVAQLQKYCDNKEWDKLKMISHKMKPSLSFIGLTNLQKELQRIETSASEREGLDKLPAIIAKVKHVIEEVLEELKIELSSQYNM